MANRILYVSLAVNAATQKAPKIALLVSFIGAIGGGAVTAIFRTETLFGMYCIGLLLGFLIIGSIK